MILFNKSVFQKVSGSLLFKILTLLVFVASAGCNIEADEHVPPNKIETDYSALTQDELATVICARFAECGLYDEEDEAGSEQCILDANERIEMYIEYYDDVRRECQRYDIQDVFTAVGECMDVECPQLEQCFDDVDKPVIAVMNECGLIHDF